MSLTIALVDDAGRLLDVRDVQDHPEGYACLGSLLAERASGPYSVAIAADSDQHLVSRLLAAAGWALAIADDRATDDFADRFADELTDDAGASSPRRRALGLSRALHAGVLAATTMPPPPDLVDLKPVLAADSALATGRYGAAVALREVLRELYPAALRAYPDPADPVALAVMDALPEPGTLAASAGGRGRDAAAAADAVTARLTADGVADPATITEAITALRVAIAETPRRGVNRGLAATVAETVRKTVAAVRACDESRSVLISALAQRVWSPPAASPTYEPAVPRPPQPAEPAASPAPGSAAGYAPPAPAAADDYAAVARTGHYAAPARTGHYAAPAPADTHRPAPASGHPASGPTGARPVSAPAGARPVSAPAGARPVSAPPPPPPGITPIADTGPANHPSRWRSDYQPGYAPSSPAASTAAPDGEVRVPNPRSSPEGPPPDPRSSWPTNPPADDWAAVPAPPPPATDPAAAAMPSRRAATASTAPVPDGSTAPVAPPWRTDLQPPAPPSLRLIEPTLPEELRDDLGYGGWSEPPPLRLVEHEESIPRSIPPVDAAENDGDLLIFAQARSAWFSGEDTDAPWHSPMDAGWQAAEQAARPAVDIHTDAGLPRRVPHANLVPGSPPTDDERPLRVVRDPASIAAHTSGYFNGWRRGQEVGGYPLGNRSGPSAGAWDFARDDRMSG